jgi:hypothetical protein
MAALSKIRCPKSTESQGCHLRQAHDFSVPHGSCQEVITVLYLALSTNHRFFEEMQGRCI